MANLGEGAFGAPVDQRLVLSVDEQGEAIVTDEVSGRAIALGTLKIGGVDPVGDLRDALTAFVEWVSGERDSITEGWPLPGGPIDILVRNAKEALHAHPSPEELTKKAAEGLAGVIGGVPAGSWSRRNGRLVLPLSGTI